MSIKRFEGHEHAAAKVITWSTGTVDLVSYSTTVARIDAEGWLQVGGLYSRTTIKHLGWFAKSLGLTYYDLKALYLNGDEMNIHTGELRKAAAA